MTSRKRIENACSAHGLEITHLEFDRRAIPTPDQYAPGGQWLLETQHEGGKSGFAGSADEIIEQIEESFSETA